MKTSGPAAAGWNRSARIVATFLLFTLVMAATPIWAADIWETVPNPPGVTKPTWIEADKAGNLYVSDLATGFHMSKDSGKTWVSINGNGLINQTNGFTIQVDPNTGNLIAGQSDDKTKAANYFHSTDQGKNWIRMERYTGVGNVPASDGVCFLPDGDMLFGGFWQASTYIGVFFSTDHGKTCTRAKGTGSVGAASSIGYNPVTKECWMGSETDGKAVFRSTDLGRSWVHVPTPVNLPDKLGDAIHIAFNNAGDVVFETMAGVYGSKDNGATWEEVGTSGTDTGGAGCLRKGPNGYLYVGNGLRKRKNPPIARSTENGDKGSWVDWSSGTPGAYHGTCIVYNPSDGSMYCVCKDDDARPKTAQIYRTKGPVRAAAPAPTITPRAPDAQTPRQPPVPGGAVPVPPQNPIGR